MKYILHAAGEQTINKHFIHMERHLYNPEVMSSCQRDIIVFVEKGYSQIYWSEPDIERLKHESRRLLDSYAAKRLLKECKAAVSSYWKIVNKTLLALEKASHRYEIAKLYDEYLPAFRKTLVYFPTISDKMTYAAEEELKLRLNSIFQGNVNEENVGDGNVKEIYQLLTTPSKPDLLFNEMVGWKRLSENPNESKIIEHTTQFSIMLPNIFSEPEALAWARRRLEEKGTPDLQETISNSIKHRRNIQKAQEKLFLRLDKETRDLSFFIREAAIVRLLLKGCWNGESYHMLPLYKKIAEIAGCDVKDLYMFYNWRDINVLLHNNINLSKSTLEKRKKQYILHYHDWQISLYSGNTALIKYNELLASSLPDKSISSFSGAAASKGIVTGRARIVKVDNPNEFQRIAETIGENDILVTGMTNPAMVVLMEKVKGIITDEGGIASHAAIISREFGIPCIVGTKIATSILKEGEMIELDANEGIVRRLEQGN